MLQPSLLLSRIAVVSKIEVIEGLNTPLKEIKDGSQISKIVRFIDERRGRWCSPRFGSLPQARVTLNLYLENNGKGVIGFGDGFFVAEFSGGKYKMDISEEEKQEFLQLMGTSQEELSSKVAQLHRRASNTGLQRPRR